jgi:hypothetical protein
MTRNPNPGDDSKILAAERRARAVELRRRRLTFAEIGADLGVSAQRAHQLYSEAIDAVPVSQVELHRAEELALIDDAIANLWPVATNHAQPRTAVEAWNSIRGWAERKARLMGLDAETKVSVSGGVKYEVVGVNPEDLT